MKYVFQTITIIVALVCSSSAQALVGCQGQVTQVQVRADGTLEAMWGWGWRVICNVSGDAASPTTVVKKEACQTLYSQFVTAQSTGQSIISYHANSTNCTAALTAGSNEWPGEQPYGYIISKP